MVQPEVQPEPTGHPSEGSSQGLRVDPPDDAPLVVLVEDNIEVRDYIRSQLAPQYRVVEANEGARALELMRAEVPDLVISDVMMPGMDGYQLAREIRSDSRLSHLPVVLLTAKASHESRAEGLETGADDYILKPFRPDELPGARGEPDRTPSSPSGEVQ